MSEGHSRPRVSVVVPVHNEEAAIGGDLDTIMAAMDGSGIPYEVIVVDDGSVDTTEQVVRARPRVRLLQHGINRGTGAALKTGIRAAQGDIIVTTDGDGTYPNHEMPRLLSHLEESDMVIGARGKEAGSWPWLRSPAKHFIRLLASYLAETRIPDLNSGLRAFKKQIALDFFHLLPSGHSWVSTITLAFLSNGYVVKFVPIDYFPRKGRPSHFHPLRDTYNYLLLVIRTIMYFNPLRVLLPLCLFLFALGLGKMVYDIVVYQWHIAGSTIVILLTGVYVLGLALLADLVVRRTRI